jgi:RNA polymerase sigma factor (sigma-70 family)
MTRHFARVIHARALLSTGLRQRIDRARTRVCRLVLQIRVNGRRSPEALAVLVERVAAGEATACDALVDEFAGLLWAITRAYGLSPADAADVAQNTWLRVLQRLDRLRDPSKLGAWMGTIARRECLNVLRQQSRVLVLNELPEAVDDTCAHELALIAEERDATLWTAVERLAPRDRALLRMLVADPQPSYVEIGAALGMPIGSIGPTRARALARLRSEAESLGLTDEALFD